MERENVAQQRAQQLHGRITALEAELVQVRSDCAEAAASQAGVLRQQLQEAELAKLRERQQLSDELSRTKVAD